MSVLRETLGIRRAVVLLLSHIRSHQSPARHSRSLQCDCSSRVRTHAEIGIRIALGASGADRVAFHSTGAARRSHWPDPRRAGGQYGATMVRWNALSRGSVRSGNVGWRHRGSPHAVGDRGLVACSSRRSHRSATGASARVTLINHHGVMARRPSARRVQLREAAGHVVAVAPCAPRC